MPDVEPVSATPPAEGTAKLIKRYTNRKLYDTVESRYVTLEQVGEMVRQGLDVRVIDNRTKEDLTAVTFAQIIFEHEKKRSQTPLALLRDILQNGGEALTGFLQSQVAALKVEAEELRARLRVGRDGGG